METISVHGAPSEYICQEGILNELEAKLVERGFQKVLIVHGHKSWLAAKSFLPSFTSLECEEHTYRGECSLSQIETLAELVVNGSFDGIIGIGGGKVLDLVKAACHLTKKPSVLIPTLASNCAPWTPISVIYDELGGFIRYDVYPVSASLVLIEPKILLDAPINMLIAGIGDTLAKWYEADVQMAGIENKSVPLQVSHYTARMCKDVLLQHSERAINAARAGVLNEDFMKVSEAIIMLGGMVGGFGDHYGRIAAAHSIHNGLTVLKETHQALHGEKVAYGILVQLMLEGKQGEVEQLLPFYHELGLPVSLRHLGIKVINDEVIAFIAEKSAIPEESIHVMPIGDVTAVRVSEAIAKLEKMNASNFIN
ncbi:iron-containing alcohol dehydrogenase family protein [Bacillus sp. IB182487]|uniref:Iron-containing alcohol dehydrogenase family protein n=1 Tax=Metabacillus arenae TaxID=2771434 RepID=A0A926NG72_9BACI|nr:iron-containing alcohol dehydrogenase family protein [Metabacillus arenae]